MVTGRRKVELFVCRVTLLTSPFLSGFVVRIRPIDHLFLGAILSFKSTMCTCTLHLYIAPLHLYLYTCTLHLGAFHLGFGWRIAKDSFLQQKTLARYWTRRQRFLMYKSARWKCPGGGNRTTDFEVSRWLGVSGLSSRGSEDTVVKGLELTIASISHMSVWNDSWSSLSPNSRDNEDITFLTVLICLSQTPPIWLAAGGLKVQVMARFFKSSLIWLWSISAMAVRSLRSAPTKLVPLSHLMSWTDPRLAINRRNACMKLSVSRDLAVSRWMDLLARQVKITP